MGGFALARSRLAHLAAQSAWPSTTNSFASRRNWVASALTPARVSAIQHDELWRRPAHPAAMSPKRSRARELPCLGKASSVGRGGDLARRLAFGTWLALPGGVC